MIYKVKWSHLILSTIHALIWLMGGLKTLRLSSSQLIRSSRTVTYSINSNNLTFWLVARGSCDLGPPLFWLELEGLVHLIVSSAPPQKLLQPPHFMDLHLFEVSFSKHISHDFYFQTPCRCLRVWFFPPPQDSKIMSFLFTFSSTRIDTDLL